MCMCTFISFTSLYKSNDAAKGDYAVYFRTYNYKIIWNPFFIVWVLRDSTSALAYIVQL